MKKVIVLDISEEDYNDGLAMLVTAQMSALVHGAWDEEKGNRIFKEAWLPPYDTLMDLDTFVEKIKKEGNV